MEKALYDERQGHPYRETIWGGAMKKSTNLAPWAEFDQLLFIVNSAIIDKIFSIIGQLIGQIRCVIYKKNSCKY